MVEEVLKDAKEALSLAELKRRLPKQVMHSTLVQIVDYLQDGGKILLTSKGIVWIFKQREEIERKKLRGLEL